MGGEPSLYNKVTAMEQAVADKLSLAYRCVSTYVNLSTTCCDDSRPSAASRYGDAECAAGKTPFLNDALAFTPTITKGCALWGAASSVTRVPKYISWA